MLGLLLVLVRQRLDSCKHLLVVVERGFSLIISFGASVPFVLTQIRGRRSLVVIVVFVLKIPVLVVGRTRLVFSLRVAVFVCGHSSYCKLFSSGNREPCSDSVSGQSRRREIVVLLGRRDVAAWAKKSCRIASGRGPCFVTGKLNRYRLRRRRGR